MRGRGESRGCFGRDEAVSQCPYNCILLYSACVYKQNDIQTNQNSNHSNGVSLFY